MSAAKGPHERSDGATGRVRARSSRPTTVRVLVSRTRLVLATAVAAATVAIVSSAAAPDVLAPTWLTGLVVGLVAWAIGLSVALIVAARATRPGRPRRWPEPDHPIPPNDVRRQAPAARRSRRVRTPNGARRLGAERALWLGETDITHEADGLADWLEGLRPRDGRLVVGLTHSAATIVNLRRWADTIADRVAPDSGWVLAVDLSGEVQASPGVSEVARGEIDLVGAAVRDGERQVLWLGPGRRPRPAAEFGELLARIPAPVHTVLAVLPPVGTDAIPAAAGHLDRIVLVASPGITSERRLRAALNGTEAVVDVVLVGPRGADPEDGPRQDSQEPTLIGPPTSPRQPPTDELIASIWDREDAQAEPPTLGAPLSPDAIWTREEERRDGPAAVGSAAGDRGEEPDSTVRLVWPRADDDPGDDDAGPADPRVLP